jgi:drug/metabolite transporter (DMT)-like permease
LILLERLILRLTLIYQTVFALCAFAANSILCRLALADPSIDPSSFTLIRLFSAALTLIFLVNLSGRKRLDKDQYHICFNGKYGSWISALALFTYAAGFSFAYQWLDTATGALILFACVQIGMMLINMFSGKKFSLGEWFGLIVAFSGFIFLLLPGLSAPSLKGTILMAAAGFAWAVYSVRGASSKNPLADTASNFVRSLAFSLVLIPPAVIAMHWSLEGAIYAALSGVFASALGYAIWYKVLPHLAGSVAAVSQLTVPALAGVGGIIILGEALSSRLIISAVIILIGIALVIQSTARK